MDTFAYKPKMLAYKKYIYMCYNDVGTHTEERVRVHYTNDPDP